MIIAEGDPVQLQADAGAACYPTAKRVVPIRQGGIIQRQSETDSMEKAKFLVTISGNARPLAVDSQHARDDVGEVRIVARPGDTVDRIRL